MPKTTTSPSRFNVASDDLSGSWFLRKVVSAERREGGGFGKKFRRESAEENPNVERESTIVREDEALESADNVFLRKGTIFLPKTITLEWGKILL